MSVFYLMISSGGTTVELTPDWDFMNKPRKTQDEIRTTDGSLFQYKYSGAFNEFELPLEYVNSSDRYTMLQWWEDNQALVFVEDGSSTSYPVKITGEEFPLTKNIQPYSDLFRGKLKLSTY